MQDVEEVAAVRGPLRIDVVPSSTRRDNPTLRRHHPSARAHPTDDRQRRASRRACPRTDRRTVERHATIARRLWRVAPTRVRIPSARQQRPPATSIQVAPVVVEHARPFRTKPRAERCIALTAAHSATDRPFGPERRERQRQRHGARTGLSVVDHQRSAARRKLSPAPKPDGLDAATVRAHRPKRVRRRGRAVGHVRLRDSEATRREAGPVRSTDQQQPVPPRRDGARRTGEQQNQHDRDRNHPGHARRRTRLPS